MNEKMTNMTEQSTDTTMQEAKRAELRAFCKELNEQCRQKQTEAKQVVTEGDAMYALAYMKTMAIETPGDVLLYGAAVNMLNTYVKQQGNKKSFGYFFKNDVARLAKVLADCDLPEVSARVYRDNGMAVLQVKVGEVQFSYHCVPRTDELDVLYRRTPAGSEHSFDGIRKQMCANSFFAMAEQCPWRSGLTKDGGDLVRQVKEIWNRWYNGLLSLKELKVM